MSAVLLLSYAYRSLLARFRANVISMLSVGLFVTGGTLGLAYYESLRDVVASAQPENIVVVSKGASSEVDSRLSLDAARKVALLDGIKRRDNVPLIAREFVSSVFVGESDSELAPASRIRGIDDTSPAVHGITLVQGALPQPRTLEVIVGKRLVRRFPQLVVGYEMHLPAGPSKVTGVFTANGGAFEDEIWTPRAALEMHLNNHTSSLVTAVVDGQARVPELIEKVKASKDYNATAATVAEFRADSVGLSTIARTVLLLLGLLSVIAIFAIATTMNAAVVIRMPELAALAAIGIRRSVLGRIVIFEAALLGLLGAIVGVAASALASWRLGFVTIGAAPVEITATPVVLAIGLGLGLVAGFAGGLAPMLQVRRLDILGALR